MNDKAVEEIKEIFKKNIEKTIIGELSLTSKWIETEEQLDKDLSDFLKRFEEGTIEANRDSIIESFKDNYEPQHNEGFD